MKFNLNDTVVALSTANGTAAIALVRMSGAQSFEIANKILFNRKNERIEISKSLANTTIFGIVKDADVVIDEVLVSVFKAPKSFTGEDSIEISCHGSVYIQQKILQVLISSGARYANAGEFSFRAFYHKKIDLSQAEAIADLIASSNSAAHQIAIGQMRGGYSSEIKILREKLINFASLIELELDFAEEDVEFADRKKLIVFINELIYSIKELNQSFEIGNVIKNGISIAIVGKPNAGKSTLLNAILKDNRAIVSPIPGTTRDTIEDTVSIEGVLFRFIDTAGLRETTDEIEMFGIERTNQAMQKANLVLYLFDVNELSLLELETEIEKIKSKSTTKFLMVANKIDSISKKEMQEKFVAQKEIEFISAKDAIGIEELKEKIIQLFELEKLNSMPVIVSNARHAASLALAQKKLEIALENLNSKLSSEFISHDLRSAIDQLGSITGEVTNEDLLSNIFSKFCIGK